MGLTFEWDPQKAVSNVRKHGVSFEEAATAFGDALSITVADPDHSAEEHRFVLIGRTMGGGTVVVVHMERGDNIRLISARRATRKEIEEFEHG